MTEQSQAAVRLLMQDIQPKRKLKPTTTSDSQSTTMSTASTASAKARALKKEQQQQARNQRNLIAEQARQMKLAQKVAAQVEKERIRKEKQVAAQAKQLAALESKKKGRVSRDSSANPPKPRERSASDPTRNPHLLIDKPSTSQIPLCTTPHRSLSFDSPKISRVICKNVVPSTLIQTLQRVASPSIVEMPPAKPTKPAIVLLPSSSEESSDDSAKIKRPIEAIGIPDTPPGVPESMPQLNVEEVFPDVPETPANTMDTSIDNADNNNNAGINSSMPAEELEDLNATWKKHMQEPFTSFVAVDTQ